MPARVLIADDQADVVAALRLLLRGEGFDADTARSVDEVRRRLAAAAYDLLLMDLNYARDTTSGQEGLDLLADVHAQDDRLPVIVMTGWGSIDTPSKPCGAAPGRSCTNRGTTHRWLRDDATVLCLAFGCAAAKQERPTTEHEAPAMPVETLANSGKQST